MAPLAAREREAKAERLEVRLAPSTKALLSAAAHARHTTLSEFLISSAVREAEAVLASPLVFLLDDGGWDALTETLDQPAEVNPALAEIAKSRPPWDR
jgi:uncharacterized protein (DUF1778 family)